MIGMMHDYFIYFALSGLLLALIYLIIMCYYGNGIFFTETTPDPNQIPSTFISVVVCFRNEEKNLARLIQGLAEQNYPTNLFEIILYDFPLFLILNYHSFSIHCYHFFSIVVWYSHFVLTPFSNWGVCQISDLVRGYKIQNITI